MIGVMIFLLLLLSRKDFFYNNGVEGLKIIVSK